MAIKRSNPISIIVKEKIKEYIPKEEGISIANHHLDASLVAGGVSSSVVLLAQPLFRDLESYTPRQMNDTTLPITNKTKKANPRQRSNGNGGRVKKGFGLHDWMTLLRHAKDLAHRKGMQ